MKIIGIVTGVLMSILGVYAICVPVRTFLGIGWFLGITMFFTGIEMLVMGIGKKKKDGGQIVLGILEALAGCFFLFSGIQRALTDVLVAYVIGFVIIFYGVYQIVCACKRYKEAKGSSIFKIICGVLSVIAGVLSVGHPVMTMISIGYLIAAVLIFQGINTVIFAMGTGNKKAE